ncbi:IPT/TIG domain-containing protein [Cohnella terricola]|uniref:VWA domain-containing protein n=1 Tax=Cohnella terricola TaxID=1289167 RepID=A0A559J8B7_9BACL|nr:IPT/TIG domain-containing protein [Cohnella terricola]TVX96101.1 VWA domain-containing protein [Cohnella terricola]
MKVRILTSVLAFLLLASGALPIHTARAAVNDYVTVTKSINPTSITTEQEAEVNLQVKGTPPANVVVPNDVILIIDKSGSMNNDNRMTSAKTGAKGFVDLMDMTKHRVGIIDYSSETNIKSYNMTTDKVAVKNYIDTIQANGSTATGDAIQKAIDILLADKRPEAQPVIVILTDGDATVGSPTPYEFAKNKAQSAKDQGIIFYTIALLGPNDNPDTSGPNQLLKEMATTAAHHHFVLGSTGLAEIYAAIVREIGLASAYNVTVSDIVTADFEIVPGSYDNNIPKPTVTGNTITWAFNELKDSNLTFTYKIRPVSKTKTGTLATSASSSIINYSDYAGAARTKAIPNVNVTVKWPAPVITQIVESSGHPDGGNQVTISGKHFKTGATVTIGTKNATNVQIISDTEIKATVPSNVQSTVAVKVKNTDGQTASIDYQYKADPIVTLITPNKGPLAGGTKVTLQGNYFMPGVKVKFGDKTANSDSYTNVRNFSVFAPAGATAGPVDLTITNPDGTFITIPAGYTYEAPPVVKPVVTGVTPNSGLTTGGNSVYVNGQNLSANVTVKFGENAGTIQSVNSTSRLTVIVPAAAQAGIVDVTVLDDTGSTILENAYTYNAPVYPDPTITSISPNSGFTNVEKTAVINGTNFRNGAKVYFGSTEAVIKGSISSTKISVDVPNVADPGKVDVRVVNDDQKQAVLAEGYEYIVFVPDPVTVTNLGLTSGKLPGGDTMYITGTNFKSGAKVYFGSKPGLSVSVLNSTKLSVAVPAGDALGVVDVTVTNPDGGTGTLPQSYTYTAVTPTITSLSPDRGVKDKATSIYINGTNFESSGMTVKINDVVVSHTFISATRLSVVVPVSATAGVVPIEVTLAIGTSAVANYTYENAPLGPTPTITSLSSNNGSSNGGNSIYVVGTNFVNGSKVYVAGVQATATYTSATRLTLKLPAGSPGPVEIKVVNPDGQESNGFTYTYN